MIIWAVALLIAPAWGCNMIPSGEGWAPKSPGDNFFRIIVNGNVERYAPGQRYVVTLVGSRTHDVVQQFTKFKISLEPLDPDSERSSRKQGSIQLFADTLTKFDEECTNSVVEADDLPKTEVVVMWKAPPAGSGCVLIKAMVYEDASRWFAEDGQLTKRICEDTSLSMPDCCACDDAKYKIVFEGLWSAQTHPKDFPSKVAWLTHFSDVIAATHPTNFSFWGEGQIATDGFRSLAEWGSVRLLESELRQRGTILRSISIAPGLWHPHVNGNTSAAVRVDRKRHLLSLASMFGPSPDWVVGVNGLDLCRADCTWKEAVTVDLYPYDAGTDSGISYLSPNAETIPRERMSRITTMYPEDPRAPFYNPRAKEMPPLARLYLTREKLISRSCDEETLQHLLLEEAEETHAIQRPECAVSEWSSWSPCSVSCGKGLRVRTRRYYNNNNNNNTSDTARYYNNNNNTSDTARYYNNNNNTSDTARCDTQLVSREMCAAAVPECPSDQAAEDDQDPIVEAVAEVDPGLCSTTPWSPWSECSVSCGIGVSTRRRSFHNHMGLKKCPLVSVEENRKCMEPECTSPETSLDDAACPTSAWAGWSPCSASCGAGLRLRTRLLLVPADMQLACSAKVELLQQQPCKEKDDCSIDMATAKRICMETADAGPCRGGVRRWTFIAEKRMCIPFVYGGCRGNKNNFLTQEECLNTCSVTFGGGPTTAANAAGYVEDNSPTRAENSAPLPAIPDLETPIAPIDCEVSEWGEWSSCSVSCGTGHQDRTRTVLREPGPGGAPCPSRMMKRRRCQGKCTTQP